jgi:hypothetical protein
MAKNYIYQVLGNDCYKVVRIDDKYPVGHKERFIEYIVNLRTYTCGCKEYHYSKQPKTCGHLKEITEQLKLGGGFLYFGNNGEYDKLIEEVRRAEHGKTP